VQGAVPTVALVIQSTRMDASSAENIYLSFGAALAGNVMPERTTHSSVTFVHPFSLAGVDGVQPAGTYTIETVEETLDNLSFVAYRRVSTTIVLPAVGIPTRQRQVVTIDPQDLEAAQKRDAEIT
jgi:hypothetical protein